MAEAAADSDAIASDDDAEPPLMHPTFFQLKAKPPAAASGKFPPPPPVPPANVPPIFVMAPDPATSHPQQASRGAVRKLQGLHAVRRCDMALLMSSRAAPQAQTARTAAPRGTAFGAPRLLTPAPCHSAPAAALATAAQPVAAGQPAPL